MAYLDINKLAAGHIFKGCINDSYLENKERYVKMEDGKIKMSLVRDGAYVEVVPVVLHKIMTLDTWVEVKEVVKNVPALTELAKALLEIPETRVVISFGSVDDSKEFLEALENSTEFKWFSGTKPTQSISFKQRKEVIFLNNDKKEITWGNFSQLTTKPHNAMYSIYLDYELMLSDLVEMIEIRGVE